MYKQIFALLLLIVFASASYGQNKESQSNSGPTIKDDGKPKIINPEGKTPFPYHHTVDKGLLDKSGNLWFGTSDGLYRYDGKLFTNYRAINGLSVDGVSAMLEDKEGNVWFGAIGGIVRYDRSASLRIGSPSFTSIKIQATHSSDFFADLKNNLDAPEATRPVSQIMEGRNGVIWFYVGYNLYCFDGKSGAAITTCVGHFLKSEKVQYHCANPTDFGISCIYEDKEGNILVSTSACSCGPNISYLLYASRTNHPCVLNKCRHNLHSEQDLAAHNKEIAASFTSLANEDGNTRISFSVSLQDKAGNVWMGSDSGVYRYDGKRFIHLTRNDILSKSVVSTIYEDKSGNIWFGTAESTHFHGSGVFRYDPSASLRTGSPSITQFTTKDGLCNGTTFKNNIVSSITEDNLGRLWFAGYGGVCRYDGKTFTDFTKKDGYNEQPVNCIVKDKAGSMWFGTWDLGLYRYDSRSLLCFTENIPGL